jgi:hypothetical protein
LWFRMAEASAANAEKSYIGTKRATESQEIAWGVCLEGRSDRYDGVCFALHESADCEGRNRNADLDEPNNKCAKPVCMVSSDDGWIVGGAQAMPGTMIHWNGTDWTNFTDPTTADWLNSGSMISSADGWAVGQSGTIVHWDGTSWTEVTSPTTAALSSVYMVDSNDWWGRRKWPSNDHSLERHSMDKRHRPDNQAS